jgi:hypothetical protein
MPNSAYYKADIDPKDSGQLFWEFVAENFFLIGLAILPPWRRLGVNGLVLFALVMAYVIGFYSVRPSISYLHRFYLPALPAVAILASATLARLAELGGKLAVARAAAVALLLWALVGDQLQADNGSIATFDSVLRMNTRMLTRTRVARFVRANFAKDATLAMGDVGAAGYLVPQRLFDTFGLNDESYAHRFARDRNSYLRHLFRRELPEALVVVSRSPDAFAVSVAVRASTAGASSSPKMASLKFQARAAPIAQVIRMRTMRVRSSARWTVSGRRVSSIARRLGGGALGRREGRVRLRRGRRLRRGVPRRRLDTHLVGHRHELAAHVVGRAAELGEAAAQRARELGKSLRTEHHQPDHEDHHQLRHADSEHRRELSSAEPDYAVARRGRARTGASGPTATSRQPASPSSRATKARVSSGSNWMPALRSSSSRATWRGSAER